MLGEGAFSTVYEAEYEKKHYAIKVVERDTLSDYSTLRAFERETRLYLKIPIHPNIVRAFDLIHTDNQICLVEEFCSHGTLASALLYEYGLVNQNIRKIGIGIVSSLLFLQSRQLAHRDLKPENIFLTEDCCPKLGDFGLCCESDVLRDTICGTPFYCAPEICGNQYDPHKSDVWSFGVILFQMATGYLPWKSQALNALRKEINQPNYETACAFLPADLKEAIDKCLVVDPEQRASLDDLTNLAFFSPQRQVRLGSLSRKMLRLDSRSENFLGLKVSKSPHRKPCSTVLPPCCSWRGSLPA